jgi:hypothetical protein
MNDKYLLIKKILVGPFLGKLATLRNAYCDVHIMSLMSQQRKNALLGNGWPRNNVNAVFSTGSVPRLYNSDNAAESVSGCRVELWVGWVRDSVVIGCKCAINPITNPKPVYSHFTRNSIKIALSVCPYMYMKNLRTDQRIIVTFLLLWRFTKICETISNFGTTQTKVTDTYPTAAARVRSQVRSCGISGGQSGTGAGFLRVLRFPLPILIPPTAP